MTKMKKKWLYRALCGALAVTLTAGTAVMTPVADIVGTNITAHARREDIIAQGDYWKLTDEDSDGNYKLTIFGTIPDTNESTSKLPWYSYINKITEVTTENGAKTSADASYLFSYFENATSIDLSHLDTSAATGMGRMFYNCKKLTSLNLSGWDTSNVTNMNNMFYSCEKLDSLDVSGFDTSNVTNMNNMFSNCKNLTSLDLSGNWDTSSVTGMGSMFYHCENLTSLNLSGFNTSNVTNMSFMFGSCLKLTSLDLSGFDTSNVIYMNDMFKSSNNFTELDLSSFNTAKVQQIQDMFQSCSNLKTITVGNGWNTGNVTFSAYMFKDCTALVGGQGTIYDSTKTDVTYAKVDGGTSDPGYLTQSPIIAQGSYWKVTDEDFDGNYKLTIFGTIPNTNGDEASLPWYGYNSKITEITTEEGAKTSADARYLFYKMTKVTTMDLSNLDTSATTRTDSMFKYCTSLTSLDLSGWNTSNFSIMESMFNYCTSLTSLDLSGWNTSNVTSMYGMFYYCKKLETIIVGNDWNTDKVDLKDSSSMFGGCTALVGGQGTTFDSTKTDKTYARIDGGPKSATPGYFTKGHAPSTSYTVTWMDGTTLLCTSSVAEGESPVYNGETPTKDGCIFTGWKDDNGTFYANGTVLPNVTADTTYTAVFEKELAVGAEYYIGDTFSTNGAKYLWINNIYNSKGSFNYNTVISQPTYISSSGNFFWIFSPTSIQLGDEVYRNTKEVLGFRCTAGDGTSDKPFRFEIIYKDDKEQCEMDFSQVTDSLVSIKDADGNEVPLNANGKVTVTREFSIESTQPLAFPNTVHAMQNTSFNSYVYEVRSMLSESAVVSYDTSAFKGKVTSYCPSYIYFGGYTGISKYTNSYSSLNYNRFTSPTYVRGTYIRAKAQSAEMAVDVYKADGTKINSLFTPVKYDNDYYEYRLTQNLESDIYVYPAGQTFSLTLPEGVEIVNTDVIKSQNDNTYYVDILSNVTISSEKPVSTINSDGSVAVFHNSYKTIKDGRYIYEVSVVTGNMNVTELSIITTQEEMASAKVGDYIMPIEDIDLYTAGYSQFSISGIRNNNNGETYISSSGPVSNSTRRVIEPDLDFVTYINGSATPLDKGYSSADSTHNVWMITRITGTSEKSIELKGARYAPVEYEFTWADDKKTATVTFNNGDPVDATVTFEPDYDNKQFIYTATKEYEGVTYIETAEVSFPDLAEVAKIAVDDIVINQDMPTVTVTDTATNTVLELDKDYTVEYSGDTTMAGTATVTITAKDGSTYIGSKSVKFAVLPREMKASITNRRKAGSNAKATLSGEWYLPKNATNIKAGIARLSTDDTNITKYDVYNNGVKKASALKTTSGKYSFSLTLNSTHANQNLYAVTYVTYEIDDVSYVSISDMDSSIVK